MTTLKRSHSFVDNGVTKMRKDSLICSTVYAAYSSVIEHPIPIQTEQSIPV